MPRIRTIKPESFDSLSQKKLSPNARLVFFGLITMCDDYGKTFFSALKTRAHVFSCDENVTDEMVAGYVQELANVGSIELYQVGDLTYLRFPNWATHQRISHPTESKIPDPPHARKPRETVRNHSGMIPEKFANESGKIPVGTGNREQGTGSGTGKEKTRLTQTPIDPEFRPSTKSEQWAKNKYPNADLESITEAFLGYFVAKGSRYADWQRAWQNWVDREFKNPARPENRQAPTMMIYKARKAGDIEW